MIIYPAIDLKSGRVVRLTQGRADAETIYADDVAEPLANYREAGAEWVHVVDLDGAFSGEQANADAVRRILEWGLKVELGGGIRSLQTVEYWLGLGVQRVIIGTQAVLDADFIPQCTRSFAAQSIAVGIDARAGKVAIKGWVETAEWRAIDFARKMEDCGVGAIIYTDISRDGMLSGPNFEAQQQMLEAIQTPLIASGGVCCLSDIERFHALAARYPHLNGVITGKALYDGRLDLARAIAAGR